MNEDVDVDSRSDDLLRFHSVGISGLHGGYGAKLEREKRIGFFKIKIMNKMKEPLLISMGTLTFPKQSL